MNQTGFRVFIVTHDGIPIHYSYRKLHAEKFVQEDPSKRTMVEFFLRWPEGMIEFLKRCANHKDPCGLFELEELEVVDYPEEQDGTVSVSNGGD